MDVHVFPILTLLPHPIPQGHPSAPALSTLSHALNLFGFSDNARLYKHVDGSSCMSACMLSHFRQVRLFTTPWTIVRQLPLSRGFSRQEYWSGLPCPPPGDLPYLGIEPVSLTSPGLAGRLFTTKATREAAVRQLPESKNKDGDSLIFFTLYPKTKIVPKNDNLWPNALLFSWKEYPQCRPQSSELFLQ